MLWFLHGCWRTGGKHVTDGVREFLSLPTSPMEETAATGAPAHWKAQVMVRAIMQQGRKEKVPMVRLG